MVDEPAEDLRWYKRAWRWFLRKMSAWNLAWYKGAWRWFLSKMGAWDPYSGFITAVATAVIAAFTIELYFVSNRQWQTTDKELNLSQRPWVGLDLTTLNVDALTFNAKGGFITIAGEMKNTGHSVAVHTLSYIRIMDVSQLPKNAQMKTARLCDSPRNSAQTVGYMLFPEDRAPITQGAQFYPEDIAYGLSHALIKGRITPMVVVCIQYQSVFEDKYHLTQYVFDLLTHSSIGALEPKDTIYNLHLAHSFFGDLAY